MPVSAVEELLADVERRQVRLQQANDRNDRVVTFDCSTNVIVQSTAVFTHGFGWHATNAPGPLRGHVRVRLPWRLAFWLGRCETWLRGVLA